MLKRGKCLAAALLISCSRGMTMSPTSSVSLSAACERFDGRTFVRAGRRQSLEGVVGLECVDRLLASGCALRPETLSLISPAISMAATM